MSYNTRSPAVKRLMKEAQELSEPTELFFAKPLEDNLFEWHFTIRGPIDTDYDGGIYHGRILLPAEYPMKPPNILLMTPSGRFEINRKICLSISGYHPETWRPSWSIRTAMLAIIGFMPTHGVGAIGSLDYPPKERRKLAKSSVDYVCPQCGGIKSVLKSLTEASVADVNEAKNLASQISFTGDKLLDKTDEPTQVAVSSDVPATNLPQPTVVMETGTLSVPVPVSIPGSMATVPMTGQQQPLSFEQWFYQTKCAPGNTGQTPSTTAVSMETGSVTSPLLVPVSPRPISTEVNEQSPSIPEQHGNHDNNESTRHRRTDGQSSQSPMETPVASVPSTAPVTTGTINSIDIVSIRNQQSVLLKCIVLVAGILGFILVARLTSLHGEISNN